MLGIAALAFGVFAIAAPEQAALIYGLHAPRDDIWVKAAGVRDFGLGFALTVAVGMRSDQGIVAMLLGLAIIGVGDAILVWSITGAPVAAHLLHVGGCGLSLALAAAGQYGSRQ